jgi:hypothetical protein
MCNHHDITAETHQYHEGSLICVCCGLVVSPGHLVSEPQTPGPGAPPSLSCPVLVGSTYNRSIFFIRWLRKHNQQKFGLNNEQVVGVTRIYRAFSHFYFKEIAPTVTRTYIPPTRWLVPRIIKDVLRLEVSEPGRYQIKTKGILADFDEWWVMFLISRNENT